MLALLAATACASADGFQDAYAHDGGEDEYDVFGPPVTWIVSPGASYVGIGSVVVGLEGGGGELGEDYLGTIASLRGGSNSAESEIAISMAWRTRTTLEEDGRPFGGYHWEGQGVTQYHDEYTALSYDSYNNVSDVLELTGAMGIYVLQMTYDPNQLVYDQPEWDEAWLDAQNCIYLGWMDTSGGGLLGLDEWKPAVAGNSAPGTKAVANFKGTFDAFLLAHPDFTLEEYVGSYGTDIDTNVVWAVLDHASRFVAVPEPTALVLLLAGGAGLLLRRRRHRRSDKTRHESANGIAEASRR